MSKKLRPLGDITDELEPLLYEMFEQHKMQFHEVLGIIYLWAKAHYKQCFENYTNGEEPILKYGPKE